MRWRSNASSSKKDCLETITTIHGSDLIRRSSISYNSRKIQKLKGRTLFFFKRYKKYQEKCHYRIQQRGSIRNRKSYLNRMALLQSRIMRKSIEDDTKGRSLSHRMNRSSIASAASVLKNQPDY
jgi:hypothetical protein